MSLGKGEHASNCQSNVVLTIWRSSVQSTGEFRGQEALNRVEEGGDRHEKNPFWEEALALRDVWR